MDIAPKKENTNRKRCCCGGFRKKASWRGGEGVGKAKEKGQMQDSPKVKKHVKIGPGRKLEKGVGNYGGDRVSGPSWINLNWKGEKSRERACTEKN